jgi:hypothetical protein
MILDVGEVTKKSGGDNEAGVSHIRKNLRKNRAIKEEGQMREIITLSRE